ncbi:hypothetical protein N7450_002659 [Penicillium hetheringtonii]|uniref:RING-type domain-containing protein n=1 Tax=Penicillium hetheringtonii TaxID=911720 RepID=A0AAD6GWH2_9EURO|nr:hypothetical protein N7450_002659 [Penicillium hetheringtonii]
MSTYEIEHNTTDPSSTASAPRRRRPDLSTFFSTLSEITPAPDHRPHAVPVPGDPASGDNGNTGTSGESSEDLLTTMIQNLLNGAEAPPREVEGVSEEFCDMLDRVPKSALNSSQVCPICNNPFLEDEYPLVVRLSCHPTHLFDMECIRPWLRLRGTCPLDRTDFAKQQREKDEERKRIADEDEEEEWDGMYG